MHTARLSFLLAFLACQGALAAARGSRPNIVLVLADDLGYSDLGSYGSEIATPNIDALATRGVRFTRFYNATRCCPSRASLLTGLYPHQAGVGHMVDHRFAPVREKAGGAPSYLGHLSERAVTIAEVLRASGYRTLMSGKWHLGPDKGTWPVDRGFDRSFAHLHQGMNYFGPKAGFSNDDDLQLVVDGEPWEPAPGVDFYLTDEISDRAAAMIREQAKDARPFFLYLPYTAPHWPLHARPADIAKHKGTYTVGWDELRARRHRKMIDLGIVDAKWPLSPRPKGVPAWDSLTPVQKADWDLKMAVYAAMVESMDAGLGRVMRALADLGAEQNTLVLFLSDNGPSSEAPQDGTPGAVVGTAASFTGYGSPWANLSATPLRDFKRSLFEGGISTPLLASWPAVIRKGGVIRHDLGHIIDVMATCLDAAGARYPTTFAKHTIIPLEGKSLLPLLTGGKRAGHDTLYWEHEGARAVRRGRWKLVAPRGAAWQLYDLEADRTEITDLAAKQPAVVKDLAARYETWAQRGSVRPFDEAWKLYQELRAQGWKQKPAPAR